MRVVFPSETPILYCALLACVPCIRLHNEGARAVPQWMQSPLRRGLSLLLWFRACVECLKLAVQLSAK